MRILEICAGSVESAIASRDGGAKRIELCAALEVGGVTPSAGVIAEARKVEGLVLNVIIRPRGGDFLYNGYEVACMEQDIRTCKQLGVDGVVIGALTADGDIDTDTCKRLIAAADGMSITFHRAFDMCRDPRKALEDIVALDCDRLLSSGQECSAEKGAELLSELVEQAAGRIIVMPGAGIRPSNIALIEQKTGAAEFHSTARVTKSDGMNFTHPRVSFAVSASDEGRISLSDRAIVSQLVNNSL
jgi:copper homeostasis protein